MSKDKWFVWYSDMSIHGHEVLQSFATADEAMTFVNGIKRREANGERTGIEKIVVGEEVKIEPVSVATEWRVKD